MWRWHDQLAEILNQAQRSKASHQRLIGELQDVYRASGSSFKDNFIQFLNRVLLSETKDAPVERLVAFFVEALPKLSDNIKDDAKAKKKKSSAKGATADDDGVVEKAEGAFAFQIIQYLLSRSDANTKGVRFRCCQIIAGLMAPMKEIDNSLWDSITEVIGRRIADKSPNVRAEAVRCLAPLQDPRNPKDPVVMQYLDLLASDDSKEVRKAILDVLGVTKHTLAEILRRTRDTDDGVRKRSYELLSKRVPPRTMSIAERVRVLGQGLRERSEPVKKKAVEMLVNGWLSRPEINGDVVKLVDMLDVEANEETAELAVRQIYESHKIETPFDDAYRDALQPSHAFFYRTYCQWLLENKVYEALESVLPNDIDEFCKLLDQYAQSTFVVKQLLLLARCLDFADEMGRRRLAKLLQDMLPKCDDELVKPAMQLLRVVHAATDFNLVDPSMGTIGDRRAGVLVVEAVPVRLRSARETSAAAVVIEPAVGVAAAASALPTPPLPTASRSQTDRPRPPEPTDGKTHLIT